MDTKSLRKPVTKTAPKLSRTELDILIREREELVTKKRALDRESDGLGRQVSQIDARLLAIVDEEAPGPDRTLNLKSWRLSIVQQKLFPSWLTEFTKRCGQAAVDEVKAALGTRDKLQIESREKPAAA